MAQRTYADSGVYIAIANNERDLGPAGLRLLNDPNRILVASKMVELETLPDNTRMGYAARAQHIRYLLLGAVEWLPLSDAAADLAIRAVSRLDIEHEDALHAALACLAGAEFVTTEARRRGLYKFPGLKVTHLMDVPAAP